MTADSPVWMINDAETARQGDSAEENETQVAENPSLLSVAAPQDAVTRTSGDGADANTGQVVPASGGGRDTQQFLDEIAVQKKDLARLYNDKGELLPGTIEIQGHKLTTEQYRDMVVTNISRLYEAAIDTSKGQQVPGNESRIATGMQNAVAIEQELRTKYGIDLPKGIGGKLTTYSVEQQMEATTNPEAKKLLGNLRDAMLGVNTAAVNQNLPDQVTMQYADFLRTVGLTKQADTLLKGMEPNTVSRYSNQYAELNTQIANDFAQARGRIVTPDKDPLATLEEAKKRMAAGDNAGAEAAFAKAYEQYNQLPKDQMAAEVKKLTDAQAAIDKQMQDMEKEGLLTPAKTAAFQMQKNQLLTVQAGWEQLQVSKHSIQLEHAHYLLNQSPTKDSVETRRKAQEMLDEVRYTDQGKLALMMDIQVNGEKRFTTDMMLAGEGKPQSAQAFKQYGEAMQQAATLYQEATKLREDGKDDEAEAKLRQARMNAENARSFASHIDTGEARYQGEQAHKNLQRLVDAEKARPEGERNNQKIAFLENMLKPKKDQDPANTALLDNLMQPPDKIDQTKLKALQAILKDDYSIMEVAQLHATMSDAAGREHAANSARMFMLQIDCETGKAENNPLTKEIEANDPDGRFRAMLDWGQVKEATRDIKWYESLWNGLKDIGIGLVSGLVAVGAFALVTAGSLGWGAPAGVAVGLAAGTATYTALKALSGEKVTLWTVGEGVVNSAAGLVTMGMGGAIAGQLGKSAITSVWLNAGAKGLTYFGAGMAGNLTYHTGMESLRYGQGGHTDMLAALKSAGSQSLSDAPYVAMFSVMGGAAGRNSPIKPGSFGAINNSLNLANKDALMLGIRSWTNAQVSASQLYPEIAVEAQKSRHYQRLIDSNQPR